jgi:hypothetical protein
MPMVDPTEIERRALAQAGLGGGTFIERDGGGTDIAQWTAERYAAFIAAVVGSYVDALVQASAEGLIPGVPVTPGHKPN